MKYGLACLAFVVMSVMFACNNVEERSVTAIRVDPSSVATVYQTSAVDIDQIMIEVVYNDDTFQRVPLSESMIHEDDRHLLTEVGTHQIRIRYLDKTTTLTLTLEDAQVVIVSFDVVGGVPLADLIIEPHAPLVLPVPQREGYVFNGWLLGDELFEPEVIPTTSITLRASWVLESHMMNHLFFKQVEAEEGFAIELRIGGDVHLHAYDLRVFYDDSVLEIRQIDVMDTAVANDQGDGVVLTNYTNIAQSLQSGDWLLRLHFKALPASLTTITIEVIDAFYLDALFNPNEAEITTTSFTIGND